MSKSVTFILGGYEAEQKRLMNKHGVTDIHAHCYLSNHNSNMCILCGHSEECAKIAESEMGFWKRFWWKLNKKWHKEWFK